MTARRCRRPGEQGFTLMELIVVIVVLGVLATLALPRLEAALGGRAESYRDSVVAGLRLASATAQSHRRLVCASFDANSHLALRIAAANPATACSHDLPGPDASTTWARAPSGVGLVASPGRSLYFQPDGQVTSSGAASSGSDFSLVPTGMSAITVRGSDGLVE